MDLRNNVIKKCKNCIHFIIKLMFQIDKISKMHLLKHPCDLIAYN